MKILNLLLAMVVFGGLVTALRWNLSLPEVVISPTGEKICALDSRGKRIPLSSVGDVYHTTYALQCPKEVWP